MPTLNELAEHNKTLNDQIDLYTHITNIINFIIAKDYYERSENYEMCGIFKQREVALFPQEFA